MELHEQNPEATPELFYCSRDDNGNTIYDQIAEDTSSANDSIRSLRRKVAGGDAEFRMYADRIEIYYNDTRVAGAELVADYYTTSWQSVTFDFTSATITKIDDGTFRFIVKDGDNIFGLEWTFAYGMQTKQTFYLDVPDKLVRIRWRVEVLENALESNRTDHKGLTYSIADYTGAVDHTTPVHPTEGWAYHVWAFEPDGYTCDSVDSRTALERYQQGAGLLVDPYLDVLQFSIITVMCDGYDLKFYTTNHTNSGICAIVEPTSSNDYRSFQPGILLSATVYRLSYDEYRTTTILEISASRIVVQIKGNWDSTSGSGTNYLNSGDEVTFTYYIYPDRVVEQCVWVDANGHDFSSEDTAPICGFYTTGSVSNPVFVYEDTGSELTSTNASFKTAGTGDYVGFTSDEIRIIGINLEHSNDSVFQQYMRDNMDEVMFHWVGGGATSASTKTMTVMWIIDSVDRAGSAFLYGPDDRLEQGIQYTNFSELTFTSGLAVTSGAGVTSLGTTGFGTDGAYHVIASSGSDTIDFNIGQIEHKTNVVIEEFPYKTGSTDYLVGHWKCNDATSTADDATANANDGTYYNTPTYNGDSVTFAAGTSEYLDIVGGIADLTTEDTFTVMIKFTPDFAYNVATNQYLLCISNGDENLVFYYNATTDIFNIVCTDVGNTDQSATLSSAVSNATTYTTDISLEAVMTLTLICNLADNIIYARLNSNYCVRIESTDLWDMTDVIDTFRICRSEGTVYGSYEIHDIKLLDNLILPYGAFFTGNSGTTQLADTKYNKDISFYWNGSDCITPATVQIGGVSGVLQSSMDDETCFVATGGIGANGGYYDNQGNLSGEHGIEFPCTAGDIIDPTDFKIGMWFIIPSYANWDFLFNYAGVTTPADNYIEVLTNGGDGLTTSYRSGGTSHTLSVDIDTEYYDGEWNYMEMEVSVLTDEMNIYMNGVRVATRDSLTTWGGGTSGVFCIGQEYDRTSPCDYFVGEVYVTKAYASRVPTAFGTPIDIPILGDA